MTDIYKLEGTQLHTIFKYGKRYLENMKRKEYYEWSYKAPTVKYEPLDRLPKTFIVSGKPCYLEVVDTVLYSLKLVTDTGCFIQVADKIGHWDKNENLGRLDGPALYSINDFRCVAYSWVVNNKTVDYIVKNFEEDLQKPVYEFSESEMEIMKFEMLIATKS